MPPHCAWHRTQYGLGALDDAIRSYRRALALVPRHAEALNSLGVALRERGERGAARAAFEQSIAADPAAADSLVNLGALLREEGALDEAIAAECAALVRRPALPHAETELIYAQALACDWTDFTSWQPRLMAAARQPNAVSPFVALTQGISQADQLFCARQWVRTALARTSGAPSRIPTGGSGKIRIGYLSADLGEDVVGFLLPELIERHDRSDFTVEAFCSGGADNSAQRRRLRDAFDRFTELGPLGSREAAQQIRERGIDILVDLMGYTQPGRWTILAQRPAPVQVSYLGYPATMGADFIDYIVADRWIAPLDEQPFYTERLVQLPECYQPSDTQRLAAPTPSRTECSLPEHGFVFCCFNHSYKITPAFLDIWARLLRQTPDSVLWLVKSYPQVETNLRRQAAARGVAPERLVFADRVPMADYLARLATADLFLDTLPYNAGATANDALWAGLPVLTCSGGGYTGRMAGSLLRAVGLPELVTGSLDEYEALSLRLATEPGLLTGLRDRLARNRDTAPLFDMARYTSHLEAAYRRMFETSRRGDPPVSFAVAPLPREVRP